MIQKEKKRTACARKRGNLAPKENESKKSKKAEDGDFIFVRRMILFSFFFSFFFAKGDRDHALASGRGDDVAFSRQKGE